VSASDIAYTIIFYESTKEVWEEGLQIKASYKNDEERRNAMHHKKPKYNVGRGKHLKRWQWLDRQWMRVLPRIDHELKSSNVWNTLQDHWKLYQKKHYTRDDNQVEKFREPEEEHEASNKDDWQIEMPYGDEIDDIEEACVDDDSPPPKN
jgi:hypothetical protein